MTNQNRIRGLVKLSAFLALFCGVSGHGSGRGTAEASQLLSFRIVAPLSTVCAGSGITVEVSIRNISANPVSLLPETVKAIHFEAERPIPNQLVPEYAFADEMAQPRLSSESQEPTTLQPGQSYNYSILLKNDFFKTAGLYKVSLEYGGGTYARKNRAPEGPSLFDGRLESNWLIFEVEQCDKGEQQVRNARPKDIAKGHR
jgi:hypothetical protein